MSRISIHRSSAGSAGRIAASPGYRPDIDGLRALAVATVVAYHAWPAAFPGGFTGVDVFFVISGYLITSLILNDIAKNDFSYARFFAKRARRILPSLIVVMAAVLLAGFFVLPFTDYRLLGEQVGASSGFSANFLFWRQAGYFDAAAERKPLLHLWSLGVEEQFYMVWPWVMVFAARVMPSRTVLVLGGIVLASFTLNIAWVGGHGPATFFLLPARLWELGAGGVLARIHRSNRPVSQPSGWANGAGLLGAGLIGLGNAIVEPGLAYPGWWAVLPALGTVLIIHAAMASRFNAQVLASKPLVWIGLISYPIYLWHWPLLVLARANGLTGALTTAGVLVLTVLLAWLSFQYVEKPIRFGAATKGKAGARAVTALLSCLVLLAGLGWLAPAAQLQMSPEWVRNVNRFRFDYASTYRVGSCLLRTDQTTADFVADCEGKVSGSRPVVLLWGDSYAAHLYPGLAFVAQDTDKFTLAQFTAGGCAPILGVDYVYSPNCRSINDWVWANAIERLHPDQVVLAGNWGLYNGKDRWPDIAPPQLAQTVRQLLALGIRKVIAIGPVPDWQPSLPSVLERYYFETRTNQAPARLPLRNAEALRQLDGTLRAAVTAAGGLYVSALDALCTEEGCLTTLSSAPGVEPVSQDRGHLTPVASREFARQFEKTLLP